MIWKLLKLYRHSKTRRRQPIRKVRLVIEAFEDRLAPSVSVLNFHYDMASSGLNANETLLTPANVNVNSFGKLSTTTVDGTVYAEPVIKTGVLIGAGPNTTAGVAGTTHDVVFVPTGQDSLYAIDSAGGAVLWRRNFLSTAAGYIGTSPGTNINNTLGATAFNANVGIEGTPVIDPTNGVLYLIEVDKETIGGNIHDVHRLHAIDITNGTDVAAPFLVGDTYNGNTNNTPIYAYGTGDGSVTDPYNGTGKPVVQFNALREHQRAALSLVNGTVYVAWASHGDNGPYHGWVVAWNVANVTTNGLPAHGGAEHFAQRRPGRHLGRRRRTGLHRRRQCLLLRDRQRQRRAAHPQRQRFPDQRQLHRGPGQGSGRSDHQPHPSRAQRLGAQGRRLLHPLQRHRPGWCRLGLRLRRAAPFAGWRRRFPATRT